jgi:hypothetical protein
VKTLLSFGQSGKLNDSSKNLHSSLPTPQPSDSESEDLEPTKESNVYSAVNEGEFSEVILSR